MKRGKTAVLRKTLQANLAAQYGIKGLFYCGDRIGEPGVAICRCNDGLRPVIFKLEATEEDAAIGCSPVKE